MRNFLFVAFLISVPIIIMKWNLIDAKTHRWNLSDSTTRVGFTLLSLVFLLSLVLLFWF